MRQAILTFNLDRVTMLSLDQETFTHNLMKALMHTSTHHQIEHRGLPIATIDWVGQSEARPIMRPASLHSNPTKILLDKIDSANDALLELHHELSARQENAQNESLQNTYDERLGLISSAGKNVLQLKESVIAEYASLSS